MVQEHFLVQDYLNPLIRSNHPHANQMSVGGDDALNKNLRIWEVLTSRLLIFITET
jgi:hypothetical protein